MRAVTVALGIGALASVAACFGDSASDISVAYRGDIGAYRELVRVRIDAAHQGRFVVPAFQSAAKRIPSRT